MKVLAAAACVAGLATVAVIALPATGSAPAGHAFFAKLSGEHGPAPDADVDGYGTFSAGFSGTKLCYGLQVFKIGNPNAAHIHQAGVNADGPIKVPLTAPASGLAGASSGCVTLTATLANQIKANPAAYYVNVHNGTYPAGAVRGQLFQATAAQDK
ncbi:MAG: CHRD domain-containing protein [Actinomycetota bacterium]